MPQFHLFSVMLCTNGLISGSLRCNVDVRPSLFVFFSIGLNVILIVSPATATYGSDVTLICVVISGGNPPYTYTWMGPKGSSRTTNITTQSITFSAVEEDAGTHQCTAQDTSSTTGSDTADLTVGRSNTQCSNYNYYSKLLLCIISPQFQPY